MKKIPAHVVLWFSHKKVLPRRTIFRAFFMFRSTGEYPGKVGERTNGLRRRIIRARSCELLFLRPASERTM